MATYKNMTNRPLPIELIGRSLSVGARKDFDVAPHEVSAQLRAMLGTKVRCIVPDMVAVPISALKPEPVKESKRIPVSLPKPPPPLLVQEEEIPFADKKEDKGNDSLTTGHDLVESDGEVPPMSARKKDRDRKASREKGGR